MTHEAAFLAEILAHPEDDAPRLLLADWWDENGQSERGEFVRVQVALVTLGAEIGRRKAKNPEWMMYPVRRGDEIRSYPWYEAACVQLDALRRRERELLERHWLKWDGQLRLGGQFTYCVNLYPHEQVPTPNFTFRRGFVERLTLTAADFLAHADALTAAAPIREVRLTTWPEFATRASPHIKNQGRLHGRREWFVLETDLIGSLTSQVVLELLAAEWDKIDFTLPPVVAFPGNLEETTAMIRDEIIRSLGIPRDMIR